MGSEVIFRGQSRWRRATALLVAVIGVVALSTMRGEAHKPITSPYTFDKDVLPIVREKCGQCHAPGGVAPMSLMTATDATPWAESIRTELIAGHMPPWPVDAPPGLLRNDRRLTGRELNTILTWATGGTPPGDTAAAAPSSTPQWSLGKPDLELTLDDVMLPANKQEQTMSFTLATGTSAHRMVRAVDLLPGTPALVRSARISVRSTEPAAAAGDLAIERQLALWQPGEAPVALERGVGFELPAGAQLDVQIRYKKTWMYEGKPMQDRSRIGIYFADDGATPVRAATLRANTPAPAPPPGVVSGSMAGGRASQPLRVLAMYPDPDMAHVRASVQMIVHAGHAAPDLLAVRADPSWARRYWFTTPIALQPGDTWAARFEPYTEIGAASAPASSSRAITLDVVAAN